MESSFAGLVADPLRAALGFLGVATALLVCLSLSEDGGKAGESWRPERGPAGRVVSLMPNLTEIAAGVGAGDRLVGISNYCAEPAELCEGLPRVGGNFDPDLERILALEPDLVLLGEGTRGVEIQLAALGIASRRFETKSFASIEAAFASIGRVLGATASGERLARELRAELLALRERARAVRPPGTVRPRALVVVHHLPDEISELFVAGRETFLGEILELCQVENAMDAPDYPAITRETLLELDPDIILDLQAPGTMTPPTEAEALKLWNELGSLRAVANGQVHYRSSAAHVVPGPRLVTALVLDDFARMLGVTTEDEPR